MHKAFKACTAVLLALVMTVSLVNGALAAVVRNDDDTISYEPLEQGVYSKGSYTIDKVSHPTLGAGEVDGILTGDLQDRGQSYSWSMVRPVTTFTSAPAITPPTTSITTTSRRPWTP